jgi:hypothetical protein
MSETWVELTNGEVLAADSAERAAIAAIKKWDDLDAVTSNVVAMFRDAIASRGHTLGDAGTIPSGFKSYAISLALWLFVSGVAKNESIHTAAREKAAERAEELLQSIREGKISVPLPDGTAAGSPRSGNWNSENKLHGRTHPVPRPGVQENTDYANPDAPEDEA